MAVEWIKRMKGMGKRPEVLRMAAKLKPTGNLDFDRKIVVESLFQVWEWADDNVSEISSAGTGRVSVGGNAAPVIDHEAGIAGFAESMISVGWLVLRKDIIEFPHYDRHNGLNAKTRARNSRNQNNRRVTKMSPTDGDALSSLSTSDSQNTNEGDARGSPMNTPGFRSAWAEWLSHRQDKRKPVTQRAAKMQLKSLEKMGHDRAIAAIEHSIANDWQGIFEPDSSARRPGNNSAHLSRVAAKPGKYDRVGKAAGVGTVPPAD